MDLAVGDLVISCEVERHPLLGDAYIICDRSGEPLTAMSALDFDRPVEIPIIAEPVRLPHGAGSLLLNLIAERARDAGISALRYAGPYPTAALYQALRRSFRPSASELEFTANVLERALHVARDPVPVDFTPAPHTRVLFARGHAEIRDGIERAVIDGLGYAADEPHRTLVDGDANLAFGGPRYAHVARFSATGELVEGPHPIPPVQTSLLGQAFDAELRTAIGELVDDFIATPLGKIASETIAARTLEWADLGARAAIRTPTGFALHAAIWEDNKADGPAALVIAMATALQGVVTQTIVAELQPLLAS